MDKPFDISDLEKRLKDNGLPAVEGLAKVVTQQTFAWLKDSLALEAHSNPLFAIGIPVVGALEPLVEKEIDQISPAPTASS